MAEKWIGSGGDMTITQTKPSLHADGTCNKFDPLNWGDPENPTAPCGDYFPTVYARGGLRIQAGGVGQGVLLPAVEVPVEGRVAGDLDALEGRDGPGHLDHGGLLARGSEDLLEGLRVLRVGAHDLENRFVGFEAHLHLLPRMMLRVLTRIHVELDLVSYQIVIGTEPVLVFPVLPGFVLEPGEPGGRSKSCPISAAIAVYDVSTAGTCSYRYQNSSAISPSGAFEALASIEWVISTSDPAFDVSSIRTWSTFDVAVAEAQAVVTG